MNTPEVTRISFGIPFDVHAPIDPASGDYVTDLFRVITEELYTDLTKAYPGAEVTVFCDHSEYMDKDFSVTFTDPEQHDYEEWWAIRDQIENELLPPIIARHITY